MKKAKPAIVLLIKLLVSGGLLAYLLARTADTIADTQLVPLEQRLEALQALRARILGANLGRTGQLIR